MTDIIATNETPDDLPDIVIGCVGYERRSIHNLENGSRIEDADIVLFDYRATGLLSYPDNIAVALARGAQLLTTSAGLLDAMLRAAENRGQSFLEIDITSLDREKLALLLGAVFKRHDAFRKVRLTYFPRKYTEPKYGFDVVNAFGPVRPELMGNVAHPRDELTVVVGAGYEYGKVIGAIDTLEPAKVICFAPEGTDKRYDAAVLNANLDFAFLGEHDTLLWYPLSDPFALYYNLRRIVEIESSQGNVLILPLGPKMFAGLSLIVALALHPTISVWRHSTASADRPSSVTDAEANGEKLTFTFSFQDSTR